MNRFKHLDPSLPSLLETVPEGNIAWRSAKELPWIIETVCEGSAEAAAS